MAWRKPHGEFSDTEVEKRYEQEQFPDICNLACGAIIQKCWREEYESASDVLSDLKELYN